MEEILSVVSGGGEFRCGPLIRCTVEVRDAFFERENTVSFRWKEDEVLSPYPKQHQ